MTAVGNSEMGRAKAPDVPSTEIQASDATRINSLDSLTGLRFVCAGVVFIMHAVVAVTVTASASPNKAVGALFVLGVIQVSVFFVLSGFVLTWSARPHDSARGFWWRRFVKIYPNHLVIYAVMLPSVVFAGVSVTSVPDTGAQTAGIEFGPALANLFLVQTWVPNAHYLAGLNGPSWSLCVEVFCYLLFPLLIKGVCALPGKWLWPAAVGTASLVWMVPVLSLAIEGPVAPYVNVPFYSAWFATDLPPSRLPEFMLGMVLARIVQERQVFRISATLCTVVATICFGIGLVVLPFQFLPAASTVVPVGLLILSLANGDLTNRACWLRGKFSVYLGRRSYAFYLVHFPVIMIMLRLIGSHHGSTLEACATIALFFVVAATASWLLYRFVESAAMRRLTRLVPRMSTGQAMSPDGRTP